MTDSSGLSSSVPCFCSQDVIQFLSCTDQTPSYNYLGIFLLPILHLEAVPVFWFLFPLNMFMACFYYFVFGLLDLFYLSFNVRCLLTQSVEQSCSLPDFLKSKVLAGQRSALVMTPKFLCRIDNGVELFTIGF